MINQFGGSWTDQKMNIVVSYAKAYLTIMKEQNWAKTIYFDGFAGSLRNSMNSIMYHFMMATNNTAALKIANDVIKPKYKL